MFYNIPVVRRLQSKDQVDHLHRLKRGYLIALNQSVDLFPLLPRIRKIVIDPGE